MEHKFVDEYDKFMPQSKLKSFYCYDMLCGVRRDVSLYLYTITIGLINNNFNLFLMIVASVVKH